MGLVRAGGDVLNGLNEPQPAPTDGEGANIWDLVRRDMERHPLTILGCKVNDPLIRLQIDGDMGCRDHMGRKKYGKPLRSNNGRDALRDAYQEALDLCAYLRQLQEDRGGWMPLDLAEAYRGALTIVVTLRSSINE